MEVEADTGLKRPGLDAGVLPAVFKVKGSIVEKQRDENRHV